MRTKLAVLALGLWFVVAPLGLLLAQGQPAPPTVASAEATRPGVPPMSIPPSESLGWGLCLSILANELMKKLKRSNLVPWMTAGTGSVNAVVATVLAGAAAAGIHTEFDAAHGTLLVTGITGEALTHFAGEWLKQWTLQHFVYHATKEPYGEQSVPRLSDAKRSE